ITLDIRPLALEEFLKSKFRGLSDMGKAPLAARNPQANYWFEYLPAARTLYLAYNKCENAPDKPFADFVKEVFAVVDKQPTEKFVVDLRHNGGGSSFILKSLYDELRTRPRLTAKGKLFVIVSNETFSSAFKNAIEMRDLFGAIWVGAPPAQRPSAYGEVKVFQLPHSKIDVRYSTKFYGEIKGSNLSFVPVDIPVQAAFADYREGRDAVLQAALDYEAK
ncbi:MAG: hypothetical protein ACRD68_13175, partial [Pyrinomonadaceae bacterium]